MLDHVLPNIFALASAAGHPNIQALEFQVSLKLVLSSYLQLVVAVERTRNRWRVAVADVFLSLCVLEGKIAIRALELCFF